MIEVSSKSLRRKLKTDRLISELIGTENGPVFIFTAGLHGNESSGVFALKDVFDEIKEKGVAIHGTAIALAGNMQALHVNQRYIEEDLNRIWTADNIEMIKNGFDISANLHPERKEMFELYQYLDKHFKNREDKEFFIDLHTTSAPTVPFIALSKQHGNLDFGLKFNIPVVSNVDKYIHSPMLAHANHTGSKHISLGFEAGQHEHKMAYENHKTFIRLVLLHGGFITENTGEYLQEFSKEMDTDLKGEYEICFHYVIARNEVFEMMPGFTNFQGVKKNQRLALSNGRPVLCPVDGYIFMPLYQDQGDDGFFIVRKV